MPPAGSGPTARAVAGLAVLLCAGWVAWGTAHPVRAAAAPPASEIRALWVLRTSLSSPESIASLIRSAQGAGFNTLLVQVRGRGDAYYAGSPEPRAPGLAGQPASFDPLAEVLRAGHAAGLQIHAWVNVNLVSSAVDLPVDPRHVVRLRPDWLMVPRELAVDLARLDPRAPAYVDRLARWTRTQSADVEGLYTTPVQPAAVEHLTGVVRALARRYPLDGVHFDYARYPNDRFDYSRASVAEFRAAMEPRLPGATRTELARRAGASVLAYPEAFPEDWRRFRLSRMTALVAKLRDAVKAERPTALVSVAVKADIREALERRLQEWPRWLERGTVDAVAPMAYTLEAARFAEQIAAAREAAGGRQVWAGIGAYRLSPSQTLANISTARRLGADGIALFSYDSLADPRAVVRDYLRLVGRSAFADGGAAEGSR